MRHKVDEGGYTVKHAVSAGDEWHIQTDSARKPRLMALAMDGRAPAIRGMPVVEEEDAKAIVNGILAMRGADQTKTRKPSNKAC